MLLAFDIAEIGRDDGFHILDSDWGMRPDDGAAAQVGIELRQRIDRDHLQPRDQRRLGCVSLGHENAAVSLLAGNCCHGQDSARVAHGSIQRKFTDDQ